MYHEINASDEVVKVLQAAFSKYPSHVSHQGKLHFVVCKKCKRKNVNVICLSMEHPGVHKNSFRSVRAFQDRIGIWKCWFLGRGENRSTPRRKTSQSRVENQQQTQPTYDAGSGNRTRATLVGGERSHNCANPAPQGVEDVQEFLCLGAIVTKKAVARNIVSEERKLYRFQFTCL